VKFDAYERRPDAPPKRPRRTHVRLGLMNPTATIKLCACGGEIVANRWLEDDITNAVHTHRMTEQHQAWLRVWHGEG